MYPEKKQKARILPYAGNEAKRGNNKNLGAENPSTAPMAR
jgi:hypothetical protein